MWAGALGTADKCEVYYFDGASTSNKKTVTLDASNGIYADNNASYTVSTSGEVTVEANLVPLTSRVRFSGVSGLTMSLGGVTTYTGYNAETNTLATTNAEVSRTVSSDGYCTLTNPTSREITITNSIDGSNTWFVRNFPATAFRTGETGLITIPIEDTNRGWQVTGPPSLTLGTSALSFTEASDTKTVSITCNRDWTATTTATWLTLSPASGHNDGTLSVTVEAYSGTDDRTATITITAGTLVKSLFVTQGITERTFTVMGNGKTVTFKMIKVKNGKFEMGDDIIAAATPFHTVSLTKDYYMGETEVTNALWYAVMGTSPSNKSTSDYYPVESICYSDCQNFLSGLNSKLSSQLASGEQFRFPTEAEWEFAAKGGNMSKGYTYAGSDYIDNFAWYSDNSNTTTHQVKTKAANELGLYDMSGNVWEWCYDWYGSYSSGFQTNPTGPTSGSYRVIRGGCWNSSAIDCLVTNRNGDEPTTRFFGLGLRLCLGAPIEQ